eukprot:scaffold1149_cov27-Tisochrysis_lutea.AAC.4
MLYRILVASMIVSASGFMAPAATRLSSSRAAASPVMSAAVDDVMDKLKSMTLLEAAELVKAIEETFDVDASASAGGMMMAMPAGAAAGPAEAAVEEKTEFDLVLDSFPADKKIAVLKVVRELTGLGLKEAKEKVESAPCALKEGAPKAECEDAIKKLEELGAKAVLKRQTCPQCDGALLGPIGCQRLRIRIAWPGVLAPRRVATYLSFVSVLLWLPPVVRLCASLAGLVAVPARDGYFFFDTPAARKTLCHVISSTPALGYLAVVQHQMDGGGIYNRTIGSVFALCWLVATFGIWK